MSRDQKRRYCRLLSLLLSDLPHNLSLKLAEELNTESLFVLAGSLVISAVIVSGGCNHTESLFS